MTATHGELIAFRERDLDSVAVEAENMTANEASAWILERTPASFRVSLCCVNCSLINRRCVENA